MGTFIKYEKIGDDLYLYEEMYWTFEANKEDVIKVWQLVNIEQIDKNIDNLIEYKEDSDALITLLNNGKTEFSIMPYWLQYNLVFTCDRIFTFSRSYNTEELTDIILERDKWIKEQDLYINRQQELFNKIRIYIRKEITNKDFIIQNISDRKREAVIKAKSQLDILKVLENIIEVSELHAESE